MADQTRRTVYSTDPEPEPKQPAQKTGGNLAAAIPTRQLNTPVRVWLDRKGRGGKTVSVIKGIVNTPAGKDALVKHLKTKLGTGGAVKRDDIEIQGDHREKIVALLNELGYKAKSAGG
ncbi:MAG: translation initiation factor [Caldilineaceae bacterium]